MQARQKFELEKIDLVERAKLRLFETEVRRQSNLEEIGKVALKLLPKDAEPEKIDVDWLHRFSSSAQDVSEPKLRLLWANLLAQEAVKPGQFSRRTLDMLKNFNLNDCKTFQKMSQYIFKVGQDGVFLREFDYKNFEKIGHSEFLHLSHIGVLEYDINIAYYFEPKEKESLVYWDKKLIVKNDSEIRIEIPVIYVTKVGVELMSIIENHSNESFYKEASRYLKKIQLEVESGS